jgi:hypothetical protein
MRMHISKLLKFSQTKDEKQVEITTSFFNKKIYIIKDNKWNLLIKKNNNTIKTNINEVKFILETPIFFAIFYPLYTGDSYNVYLVFDWKKIPIVKSNFWFLGANYFWSLWYYSSIFGNKGWMKYSLSYEDIQEISTFLNIKSPFSKPEQIFRNFRKIIPTLLILIWLGIFILIFIDVRKESDLTFFEFTKEYIKNIF